MPLVFHQIGIQRLYKETGATIPLFLKEGLKSKHLLTQEGKLPFSENPYEFALRRMQKSREKTRMVFKDNHEVLKIELERDTESVWIGGRETFYKPGHIAHRDENVFFSYFEHPQPHRDWVAIEVPDTSLLHDPTCRDAADPQRWVNSAVTIKEFQDLLQRNKIPYRWDSKYNEYVVRNRVAANEIVAYAKVEKEFVKEDSLLSDTDLQKIKSFMHDNLSFALQFENPEDNILINKTKTHYEIRVSYNVLKAKGQEERCAAFLNQFSSLEEIMKAAGCGNDYESNRELKSGSFFQKIESDLLSNEQADASCLRKSQP